MDFFFKKWNKNKISQKLNYTSKKVPVVVRKTDGEANAVKNAVFHLKKTWEEGELEK